MQMESDSRSGSSLSLRQLNNSHRPNVDNSNSGATPSSSQGSAATASKVHRSVSASTPQKPPSRRFSVAGGESGESQQPGVVLERSASVTWCMDVYVCTTSFITRHIIIPSTHSRRTSILCRGSLSTALLLLFYWSLDLSSSSNVWVKNRSHMQSEFERTHCLWSWLGNTIVCLGRAVPCDESAVHPQVGQLLCARRTHALHPLA